MTYQHAGSYLRWPIPTKNAGIGINNKTTLHQPVNCGLNALQCQAQNVGRSVWGLETLFIQVKKDQEFVGFDGLQQNKISTPLEW